jgi:hypothetical protein
VDRKLGNNRLSGTGGRCDEDALTLLHSLARFNLEGIQIEVARNAKILNDRVRRSDT